jgi:hypothetical protein
MTAERLVYEPKDWPIPVVSVRCQRGPVGAAQLDSMIVIIAAEGDEV